MGRLDRVVRALRLQRTPGRMALGGVTGLLAGLGAVLLIKSIGWVALAADFAASHLPGRSWLFVTIPAGIFLAWALTARFAPEVSGHGVPQIIAAIVVRGGAIRARVMPLKTVATALTIGAGGSAGREGSIAQIGSAIGSWIARTARFSENDVRVMVAAGAGAGISATFNAPIAGMLFAMEVVLREVSLRHVHMVVVASVSGAVVAHSLIGEALTFSVSPYALDDARQLVLFGVLGLVAVAVATLFLVALDGAEVLGERLPGWVRPLVMATAVAGLALIRPEVSGTGQDFVESVLRNEAGLAWWVLAVLAVLKAGATAATLGGKGAGGIFMPSLFIGATAGAGFALLLARVWTLSEIAPGAYALVGMAATFAAVARAPLTAILIVFETTGDYGLVLPLMITTAIATLLAGRVRPLSAYTAPLHRMGIHLQEIPATDLLDTVRVGDVITPSSPWVAPDASLGEVQGMLQRHRVHGLPVLDEGRLVGLIAESDVIRAGGPSDQVTTAEAMTPNPVTATRDTPVSEALERMGALGVGRLPVVADDDPGLLVGMFRREDAVAAYHRALGRSARASGLPGRLQARTQPGASFFEFEIPPGSPADGRKVAEVPWPEGCVVVSVQRGIRLLVPSGPTELRAGDALTVFGGEEARRRLADRLEPRSPAADGGSERDGS